ncbi:uncharacterized protein HaLaN_15019, partial [Haematococcus lacustris]
MDAQLSDVSHVCSDQGGNLYGITRQTDGAPSDIFIFDLRKQLLDAEGDAALGQSTFTLSSAHAHTLVKTTPPIRFQVDSITVSANGRHLAVAGYDFEDEDRAVVVVVDLYGGRLLQSPAGGLRPAPAAVAGVSKLGAVAARGLYKEQQCSAHIVDYQLFASRPGLRITQRSSKARRQEATGGGQGRQGGARQEGAALPEDRCGHLRVAATALSCVQCPTGLLQACPPPCPAYPVVCRPAPWPHYLPAHLTPTHAN